LKKLFPRATRSLIYKFNRKDKIKIKFNWSEWKFKKRDNEYKLQVWDEIKIFLSDKDFKELSSAQASVLEKKEQWKKTKFDKKDIVFEDKDFFIINKNAWINVHPWDHKTKETNVIAQVQDYLWEKLNSLTFKPSLAHRIDRDTSGILIIVKQKHILMKIVEDFKNHKKIKKTYYAIVIWKLDKKSGTITKKLLRIENAKNENKVQVSEKWQKAITHYKILKEHNIKTPKWNIFLTEVEIQIETGRMHQIRVHMADMWNPILWDKAYGNKSLNYYFAKNFWLNRQALHAWKIEFFHYTRKKTIKLEAKLKKDLTLFLKRL
jgi:RluA family pseudouridine synthase